MTFQMAPMREVLTVVLTMDEITELVTLLRNAQEAPATDTDYRRRLVMTEINLTSGLNVREENKLKSRLRDEPDAHYDNIMREYA